MCFLIWFRHFNVYNLVSVLTIFSVAFLVQMYRLLCLIRNSHWKNCWKINIFRILINRKIWPKSWTIFEKTYLQRSSVNQCTSWTSSQVFFRHFAYLCETLSLLKFCSLLRNVIKSHWSNFERFSTKLHRNSNELSPQKKCIMTLVNRNVVAIT